METQFSGEIYKIIYSIGNKEMVYTVGNEMRGTGIKITKIVRDYDYTLNKQGERVVVYATINGDNKRREFIYDEIYNAPMSIRRDYNAKYRTDV